jgi:hypothetical protein
MTAAEAVELGRRSGGAPLLGRIQQLNEDPVQLEHQVALHDGSVLAERLVR